MKTSEILIQLEEVINYIKSAGKSRIKQKFDAVTALSELSERLKVKQAVLDTETKSVFSVRCTNALKNNYVFTIGELLDKSERDLMGFDGVGYSSLNEIKEFLRKNNLELRK